MDNRVTKILIVGGGTSGWMAAGFLNQVLRAAPPDQVEITLVESKDIGIIGVGEATLAHIKRVMVAMEINEMEFMRCCDASFKNAILFNGFHRRGEHFWHPFTQVSHVNRYSMVNLWLEARRRGFPTPYAEAVAPDPAMCELHKAPRAADQPFYQGLLNYAYHIDTIKLGRYLREVAVGRGVRHVVDTVTDVGLDERGYVSHVVTEQHGELTADLFLDCSGFRGLLINKAMGEPFESFNDVLYNDTAVAMRVPYPPGTDKVRPYTGCHAQDAGWIWDIPLHRRRGIGYVYSSGHIDADQAEARLREYAGPEAAGVDANHIRMRIGRTRNPWVKNVCAIGLSGGFIEPLESTGIYLTELGLALLYDHFPTKDNMATLAAPYNRHMQSLYSEIRDFICMHYCLTERDDTDYWRDCRNHPNVPDSLAAKLELWANRPPVENDLGYTSTPPAFSAVSYCYVAFGMGHLPRQGLAAAAFYDHRFGEALFADRRRITGEALAAAPDHYQLLERIHGADGRLWAEQGMPAAPQAGGPTFQV